MLPSLVHPYFELDIEQDEICKALLIKQETEWIEMILLLFANSWYSGVILTGGIYYRGASNKILTALRGCLLDKRGLLIEVGVY